MREKLIAEYHQLLAADESLTGEFFAGLKKMMRNRRLLYGGREIGVSLRPHLLTRAQYNLLTHSSEVVAGACNKVATALLAEPSRLKTVGLTEREIRLALIDPKYAAGVVTTRLDAFVHGDKIKFVEYNAENPSSLTDQAGLNDVLLEVGAMRATTDRYQLRQFSPVESLLTALGETFREWGGAGLPNVAILDWEGLPTAGEFVLLQDFFASRDVPTVICSPAQLEYQQGRLRCGDFPIDLVYKRVIIHELLEHCDDSHPLIRAYLAGDVCLVNSFRSKILQKKAAFELLTDEANASWFTPNERAVMQRTVPWTRRVAPRKTHHHGREVDLVEHVRKHQQQFVLKPNDDYGGRGVSIGERVTAAEWEAALTEALAGDYVVQEKIELRTEVFPIFGDSEWTLQPMYVDTNPFLFAGRVEGAMVRLSDSPIVNVTSGGGETGFFVIEGEA
jgi:glutathionylspermidine synthase